MIRACTSGCPGLQRSRQHRPHHRPLRSARQCSGSPGGSCSTGGGGSTLRVEHEEALAAEHQILTAPEHRFEGLTRFDGLHAFDGSREIAVHDPRLHIRMPGATAIAAAQAASQTVALGPTMPRFTGGLVFDGGRRFDGYTALRAEHGTVESIEQRAASGPAGRFDLLAIPFSGDLRFDGSRDLVMHDVTITEVTA